MVQETTKNDVISIIGIRSGSKSVVDKNIRNLNGKPLVYWIIKTALNTPEIGRVIVSTDSEKYAKIADECGAETPFIRPANLSKDLSTDFDYVKHCLDYLREEEQVVPEIAVRLMATVPFQRSADISDIIKNCRSKPEIDSSVIVAEGRQNPMKALKIVTLENGERRLVSYTTGLAAGVSPTARQSHEKAYFRANAIAFKPRVVSQTKTLTGNNIIPHIIPTNLALDIDSEIDFQFAEFLMQADAQTFKS